MIEGKNHYLDWRAPQKIVNPTVWERLVSHRLHRMHATPPQEPKTPEEPIPQDDLEAVMFVASGSGITGVAYDLLRVRETSEPVAKPDKKPGIFRRMLRRAIESSEILSQTSQIHIPETSLRRDLPKGSGAVDREANPGEEGLLSAAQQLVIVETSLRSRG